MTADEAVTFIELSLKERSLLSGAEKSEKRC